MVRSLAAVVAGLFVLAVLTFAIEMATTPSLMRLFPEALPTREAMQGNVGVKLFILFYSSLAMVVAGYVTARIAGRHELRHAIAMAVVQVALTAWAMTAFYGHAPLWAWLAGMALMLPAAALGARARGRAGVARGAAGQTGP
ncbi:hypothetical protein [Arenimonas sp. MALMAid1274]|uniref:hypothetical protein n=1 Tax=Arenimonas sp. MALMAid1274 TaxID=3411630 RepID=UPI003BA2F819